jgi:sodium transport system permease protein
MRALLIVFWKELRENARDRRTVLSALLLGPVGTPLLFALMMNITLERSRVHADTPLALAVAGGEYAPNVVAFLSRSGVAVTAFSGDAAAAARVVRRHEQRLVLVIPADLPARLRAARPASVGLYTDTADTSSGPDRSRIEGLLRAYAERVAAWRLEARGLAPTLVSPLVVDEIDVASAAGRSAALLGILSYFIVFATLMGGLYVAIDATAGERERGSLEPLLTLPVARRALVFGKMLAAAAWMAVSLVLTVTAFAFSLRYIRFDLIGMTANFGARVALAIVAVMLPFVVFGAALMTLVASFTRSYREAQSWLTAVLLVPTVPIMFAALNQLAGRAGLMWVPSLSQHLLINGLLKAEPLAPSMVALSAGGTLAAGALLALAAARCYGREQILG